MQNNNAAAVLGNEYRRFMRKKRLAVSAMVLLLILSFYLSLSVGSSGISHAELIRAIFRKGSRSANMIVWSVRMPRSVTALAVGAALSLAGVSMQCVLRNPLASASTLGVSQGACFGAAFAIVVLGAGIQTNSGGTSSALSITDPYMVSLCAFIAGTAATLFIAAVSKARGTTPQTMVLAGVAISSMFTGATSLIQYFADDVMVATVVYWTFGSLARAGWTEILIIAAVDMIAFLYMAVNAWSYNALESGHHTAASLGVNVERLTICSMLLASLAASLATAFVGCISFIGLIAPHIMKRFVGSDHRYLIPSSALCGAVLLLLSDTASRTLLSPVVLPIGAVTSFVGAPLFLYLVMRRRGSSA